MIMFDYNILCVLCVCLLSVGKCVGTVAVRNCLSFVSQARYQTSLSISQLGKQIDRCYLLAPILILIHEYDNQESLESLICFYSPKRSNSTQTVLSAPLFHFNFTVYSDFCSNCDNCHLHFVCSAAVCSGSDCFIRFL